MKIFGIGTDIVNIKRMEKSLKLYGTKFRNKVFSKSEISYCEKKKNPGAFYAKRFAAKEALSKALGVGFRKGISFKNIEISNDVYGKPLIRLSGSTYNYLKKKIIENIKTIIYALIIALIIRSFLFQPFYIPSSSMEPNLLVGDRLFVSKYSYGYSRHSLPFSPNFSNKRYLSKNPKRGDVIVFKTPADNRTDYIKRLIGLSGDSVQIINGDLYLNNKKIKRSKIDNFTKINCGNEILNIEAFEETLPNGKKYIAVYKKVGTMQNTDKFLVPADHYFFMGDNRDCSRDSRFLSSVGYVSFNNLVGRARLIFFSNNKDKGNFFELWKWNKSIRIHRFFKKIL